MYAVHMPFFRVRNNKTVDRLSDPDYWAESGIQTWLKSSRKHRLEELNVKINRSNLSTRYWST